MDLDSRLYTFKKIIGLEYNTCNCHETPQIPAGRPPESQWTLKAPRSKKMYQRPPVA